MLEEPEVPGENTIMTTTHAGVVLRHIRGLAAGGLAAQLADKQLLERFTTTHDPTAFEALLRRHGALVWGVCRRLLRDPHDAEDAFQATFLALAQKARSIRQRDSVGGWLYQVACNAALKVRASAAVRLRHERRADDRPPADPLAELTGRELLAVLDEELRRLPGRLRAPLVLCYLEGKARDEAARALGWSLGTLKRRLEQARARLRDRLERRGLALTALLAAGVVSAAVPVRLAAATARAALLAASGKAAVPAAAVALTTDALRAMTGIGRKVLVVVLLVVGLVAAGAGWLAVRPPPADTSAAEEHAAPLASAAAPAAADEKKAMTVTGRVLGPDGKPVPDASVVVFGLPLRPYRRSDPTAYRGELLAEGKADAEGQFRLPAPRTSSAQYREVYVVATAEKHAPAWRRLNADAEQAGAVLKLPPEQVVRGSFVDLQGVPAARVKVSVSYLGGMTNGQPDGISPRNLPQRAPWPEPVTTDEKGAFVIRGCNRDQGFTLAVSDDRFGTQSFQIEAPGKPRPGHRVLGYDVGGYLNVQESGPNEKGQPEVLKLPLAPARIVEGRVVYADTGKAAAKATVSGTPADEDGRFLLRFAGRDAVTLEVYAPDGEPYFSVHHRVQWAKGTVKQEVKVALPRGVLVRGKVTEAGSGKPVAGAGVQFWPQQVDDPARPKNVLTGWIHNEVTRDDGTFRMTVFPGPGHLLFQGPTPDYVHASIGHSVVTSGQPGGSRLYPDAFVKLDTSAQDGPKELAVTLRRGATVRGRLLGPDGKPVTRAVMLHRLHVTRDLSWHFADEARDGVFEVHGLDPDRAVPVYFLDAEKQCGATVELSGKQAGEAVIVKLALCGKATVRYVDGQGRPLAGYAAAPDIVVTPGASSDDAAAQAKGELLADAGSLTNLDRHNYWDRLRTDAKGRITFPALIPGATYRVGRYDRDRWLPHKEFTAESGKTIDLGDVTIKKAE
jgi:RNA polymerase sigma factor (sigma-70 family)